MVKKTGSIGVAASLGTQTSAASINTPGLSESYSQLLWEITSDAVVLIDTLSIIRYANPALEVIFGFSPQQAVGQPLSILQPERLREGHRRGLDHYLTTGIKRLDWRTIHIMGLHRDGHEFPIEISFSDLEIDGNRMFAAFLRDISQRVEAQAKEHYQQKMMERTERVGRIGSWEWDARRDVVTWSAETYRFFGRDPAQGVPSLAEQSAFYIPEDSQRLVAAVTKAMEDGQPYDIELCGVRPDGERRNCHILGYPERDESGKVIRLAGSLQDITERKHAERHAQHLQSVLKMLTDRVALNIILERIVLDVEALNPGTLCSILLLNEDGKSLHHGAAPSLPDFYNQSIDGAAIGPEAGSCGTAAFTGKTVIVENIQTHPYWTPYRALASRAKLASCWSQPIISGESKVQGTFAIYHREPTTPSSADLKSIEDYAVLTSLAISKSADFEKLQLAASVFTHAREGILITNAAGNIVDVNETFTRITGYTRDEAIGQNPRFLKSERQPAKFYSAMWSSLAEDGHWSGEVWNRRKSGEVYAEMQTVSVVRDASGSAKHYVSLFTDITAQKQQQQHLEHIAHYDALTNLPNRVLLADRLNQAMLQCQSHRRAKAVAVAYLDLDGFKQVNDKYGHGVGDEMLVSLSQHIKHALRDGDTLARIGGDEFVAVLVDLEGPADCAPVLARLLEAASQPITAGNEVLRVSASIGVTLYPQDGVDADLLLRHADQAMYIAKDSGKNKYHFFDVASATALQTQRESLQGIARALEQHQYVLHYQPKVNMKTGAVVGAEALIRWQHPVQGLLAPAAFLPLIEDHPLSVELGEWVIATAIAQMGAWYGQGLDLPVSVNIGARQLQQPNFVERLAEMLTAHPDVKAHCLQLEVLETSALEDTVRAGAVMQACKAIGVGFALDDFGTGYSSLTYLKRLPAETLKIDQSFVRDMLTSPDDLAIVQGVIGLAGVFKRSVIAEGVETAAHGQMLLSLGCELAQGFGIARPMPADDLPSWVERWHAKANWTA